VYSSVLFHRKRQNYTSVRASLAPLPFPELYACVGGLWGWWGRRGKGGEGYEQQLSVQGRCMLVSGCSVVAPVTATTMTTGSAIWQSVFEFMSVGGLMALLQTEKITTAEQRT